MYVCDSMCVNHSNDNKCHVVYSFGLSLKYLHLVLTRFCWRPVCPTRSGSSNGLLASLYTVFRCPTSRRCSTSSLSSVFLPLCDWQWVSSNAWRPTSLSYAISKISFWNVSICFEASSSVRNTCPLIDFCRQQKESRKELLPRVCNRPPAIISTNCTFWAPKQAATKSIVVL